MKHSKYSAFHVLHHSLIGQSLVAVGQIDDAAVCEAVLDEEVLHDMIVPMCVDADIRVVGEAEVHDAAEYPMDFRVAGDAMDHVVRSLFVQPCPIVDSVISRFW